MCKAARANRSRGRNQVYLVPPVSLRLEEMTWALKRAIASHGLPSSQSSQNSTADPRRIATLVTDNGSRPRGPRWAWDRVTHGRTCSAPDKLIRAVRPETYLIGYRPRYATADGYLGQRDICGMGSRQVDVSDKWFELPAF